MKKIFLFTYLLFITNCLSQAPTIQWQKSYGGSFDDYGKCIRKTQDGGFVVVGYSYSNNGYVSGNHGASDIWVVKLNSAGSVIWQKSLGGSLNEESYSFEITSDDSIVIIGAASSSNGDVANSSCNGDYWIVKLDSLGTILWKNVYGGLSSTDRPFSINSTSDGGFIVAGESASNDSFVTGNHGGFDYWVVKYNSLGIPQWQKALGSNNHDEAFSVKQTSDGGYIVVGVTNCGVTNNGDVTGSHGNGDYWVVKLNSNGSIIWQKAFGGSYIDSANDVIQTSDGGYIVVGSSGSSNGDVIGNHSYDYKNDFWILKLDSLGSLQWQKSLGGTGHDIARSIKQTPDGNYIIIGSSSSLDGDVVGSFGSGNFVYWLVKINTLGSLLWQKPIGSYWGDNYAFSVDIALDGGFVVAGQTNDSQYFYSPPVTQSQINYHVVKLSPDFLSTSSFNNMSVTVFPNPVSNQLNIRLSNNENIDKIIVTDLLGKEIISQKNTNQLSVENLANGIYLIEIFSNDVILRTKFIKK